MKQFEVSVCRIGIGFCTISVGANDEEHAAEIALELAGDQEYSEKDADYEVEHVSPVKKKK